LTKGKFTSAEFGVEMIEAPGEFTFKPQFPKSVSPEAGKQK
jgi:hypothetical protein